jgi:hypothetical protein
MATNPYINTTGTLLQSEHNLYQDLVDESIQMHGQDFYYIRREQINEDTVFNESTVNAFRLSKIIEMYVEDADGFSGEGDFLSKFGMEVQDQINVIVSIKRFNEEIKDFMSIKNPQEGDLVYWPLMDKIYEITFVEDEVNFWQLGNIYVYRLSLDSFRYSHEIIETGVEEIDDVKETLGVKVELTLGSGSGTYSVGEIVYQGTDYENSTASGVVESWNSGTNSLKIKDLTGEFKQNVNIIGLTSTASYLLGATTQFVYTENPMTDQTEFSSSAEDVIDFSITNPFSEGY